MHPKTRRILVIAAVVAATPLALLVGLLLVIESPWAERWVEARVGAHLGREVEVQGIDIQLGFPLVVALEHLRIGNPPWATTPNLIDARALVAQVEVAPLFAGRFHVPSLGAESGTGGLERQGDKATWRFNDKPPGESRLQLTSIVVKDGTIAWRNPDSKTSLDFKVKGGLGVGEMLHFTSTGTYKGQAAKGSGTVPSLPPRAAVAIPVDAKFTVGPTSITVKGLVAPNGQAMDADFTLAGKSLHELQALLGVKLPDSPPYKLGGHMKHTGLLWDWQPLHGRIGDSDIRGTLTYDKGGAKPLLKANLASKQLDIDDLGPLVGTTPRTGPGHTASPEQKAKAELVAASRKVLPRTQFHVERWGDMDADVRLEAAKVLRPKQLPLETFATRLTLKDSVMTLDPLTFGMAGGRISSKVVIDATKRPVRGNIDLDVRALQLAKLFPTVSTMNESYGTLYGRGKLSGTGLSMHELLSTSNGTLGLAVDGGRVSLFLVELLGLDFGEAIMMLGTKNRQVALRCAAGAFKVEKGRVEPESFVVDTTDTVVKVEGHVDLGEEHIKLTAFPEPKDMSFFALRSPIEIEGSFRKPSVKPRAGPIAARVAAAVALGVLAPPLAALAFVEMGPGEDTDCGKLLASARAAGKGSKLAPGQAARVPAPKLR